MELRGGDLIGLVRLKVDLFVDQVTENVVTVADQAVGGDEKMGDWVNEAEEKKMKNEKEVEV